MKSAFSPAHLTATAVVVVTLVGCATGPEAQHSQPSRQTHESMNPMNMSNSDMMSMCKEMNQQMMSARTPQERQATMT